MDKGLFGPVGTYRGQPDMLWERPRHRKSGLPRYTRRGECPILRAFNREGAFLRLASTVFALCCIVTAVVASDMVALKTGTPVREDFDGFEGTFESLPAGFAVSKTGSNCLTAADVDDFKSPHAGGTAQGACRPWDLGDGDHALGYQPTSTEFTPGFFLVTISNATGEAVTMVNVSYDVVCLNNESRSSSLELEYSTDGLVFSRIASASFISHALATDSATWMVYPRSALIRMKKPLPIGSRLWLRWYGDDAGGEGSRDEYGINNVVVSLQSRPGTLIVVE